MGQKVNPHGLRVGIIADWDSRWYAEGDFAANLKEDYKIRQFLMKKLAKASVSKIDIERAADRIKITVFTAKPGLIIGKGGAEIEKTKSSLSAVTDKKVILDIKEIKRPDLDAQLVAENNNGMNRDNLYVEECYANRGPIMKRIRPRAQGRAYRIEKRMSHITVVLNER